MGRLFGTDGVRGLANADLSPELAMSIAVAAVRTLVDADSSHQPLALVGRDPRASGEMLEAAVVAGLSSAGANVVRVGVLPTPGRGLPDRRGARRSGRDGLGEPQPDARQRGQALRRRRAQAARRHRGRHRKASLRDVDAADRREDRAHPRSARRCRALPEAPGRRVPAAPRRAEGRARLRQRRGERDRPRGLPGGGRGGHRDPRRARRPEHQRRAAARPTSTR